MRNRSMVEIVGLSTIILFLLATLMPGIVNCETESEEFPLVEVSVKSPDSLSRVVGNIHPHSGIEEKLFVYNGRLKKKRIITEQAFRYEPKITWHGNDIVEILIGTGSPGRFSLFYDLAGDVISEELWFVLAFDPRRRVALLGEDELKLVKVFEKTKPIIIKKDFYTTAILFQVLDNAAFDGDGNLSFDYMDKEGKKRKAFIGRKDLEF